MQTFGRVRALLAGRKVLDLGCASGQYLRCFGPESVGLELSEPDLRACTAAGMSVRRADLNRPLPVPDGEFDAVFCSNVLEHVDAPLTLLREARRALRHPGGVLALALPIEGSAADLIGKDRYYESHPGHLYAFSPRNIGRLLGATGFAVQRHWVEPWPERTLRRLKLIGLAETLLNRIPLPIALRLGGNYWTIARSADLPRRDSEQACDAQRMQALAGAGSP